MVISINIILFGLGALFLISVLLSKLSSYIGVPTLIVFLLLGLVIDFGSFIQPTVDNYTMVQYISIFALIIIMFSGGLDTDLKKMKPILGQGISLSIFGTIITAFVTGYLIHLISGIDLLLALLIGATISSTDAAAVFSIFRSNNTKLKNKLDNVLELESATNDPTAYILTTSLIYLMLNPTTSLWELALMFMQSVIFGAVIGFVFGNIFTKLVRLIKLEVDGLYPVLLLGIAVFTFACSEMVGGNGFLAVYIAALIMGNRLLLYKRSQTKFFDGLAWLMQVVMFIILGLFTLPNEFLATAGISFLTAVIIIFVSRPIAVFTSLIPFNVDFKSKIFLSWTGIKGAVPIVFAFYPLVYQIPGALFVFNTVFFVTIISLLLQGSTIYFVADKLNLILKS
jgi:potassium/hydrogen antiporter